MVTKGIRCEAGAVPAAVSPLIFAAISATIRQLTDGKAAANWGKPEDLPFSVNAFGNKSDGFKT